MTITGIPLRHAAHIHSDDLLKLRGLKWSTRANYISTYSTFATYLEPIIGREPLTTDVTFEHIEGYFRDYVAVKAPGSWPMRRSNFVIMVPWLMRKGYMVWGPNFVEDIASVRKTDKRPRDRRLSEAEFLKLLKVAAASHARDYFLCLFVRFTGRRIAEVVGDVEAKGIHWGDVRWEEGYILWDNSKSREYGKRMPLTPRLRAILEAWKVAYCKELGVPEPKNDWFLFPALTARGWVRKGHKRERLLSPEFRSTNANRIIQPHLKRAGLWQSNGDGWHILRKTFGNQRKQKASEQGRGDAWEMAKIGLDHSKVETTRIYVNEDEDYDRYAVWAMGAEEMSLDSMAMIPELSHLTSQASEEPAPAIDAQTADEVYRSSDVIDLSSRRKLRALG